MSHYSEERELARRLNDATPAEWDKAALRIKSPKESIGYEELVTRIDAHKHSTPYKFREGQLIDELRSYIDSTYNQHYAGGKIQATEDIIDDGHGTGFCIGNAKKYLKRYGKKGETAKEWRKDIIKVLHYSLIQLYIHDLEHDSEVV